MKIRQALLATALAIGATTGMQTTSAAIMYATGGVNANIPGLTGFVTNGSMMDGLGITVTTTSGVNETVNWSDDPVSGPTCGRVNGAQGGGWSLSLCGDTFTNNAWNFNVNDPTSFGQINLLLLDGNGNFTIFDRTFGDLTGTDGSALGKDWTSSVGDTFDILVTYLNAVGIGGAAPVGDIFQTVRVDFGNGGPRTSFLFSQDTDNDSRILLPEPATLAILGLGLVLLGLARSRQRDACPRRTGRNNR